MFSDIRAPCGPAFRPLGPRAACAARPAGQFIFLLLPPSAQIYWHVHQNTESKSSAKNDQYETQILATSLTSKCKCTKAHNRKVNI